jgi:trans-aconitate 2-methyltransferase
MATTFLPTQWDTDVRIEKCAMKEENKFTWNAKDYAKHSSTQQAWARELIAKLNLCGHESVLDIGCGDGKVTAEIAGYVPDGSVVGVDNSKEMIELASANFTKDKYPNLSFQVTDAGKLSFQEKFDVVFSNAALHWIKDHRPVIAGIQKALKPGGRILLQMGGKGNAESILSILEEMMSESEWSKYFSGFAFSYGFYEPEEYMAWISEAGLNPIRIELIPKIMPYDKRDGLAGWFRTTWLPYLEQVPEERREEFITRLIDKYIEKHPLDHEGKIHVNMVRLEVEAIKNCC